MKSSGFGWLISRSVRHGTEYLHLDIVRREEDKIRNPDSSGESDYNHAPKFLHGTTLSCLGIHAHLAEISGEKRVLGLDDVEYHDVFSIDELRLKQMFKTMKKIRKALDAEIGWDDLQAFRAVTKALKLGFVAYTRSVMSSSYDDNDFIFMSPCEGANYISRQVEEMTAVPEVAVAV